MWSETAMSSPTVRTVGSAFLEKHNNFHLIRLLAALAVIYGHAYAVTAAPGGDLFLQWVGFKFIGGVAVDVFFVISGFLITASLERNSILSYVWARCLRIFPALIVAVSLSVLLGAVLTVDSSYWGNPQTWRYWWSNAFMWKTEYFLPGVFVANPDPAVNGSLWSLPVEFRLYGIFLLLSIFGLLHRSIYTWFALLVLLAGLVLVPKYPVFTTYANWVNVAAYFMAGALVWSRRDEIPLSPWGVIAVVVLCMLFHGTSKFHIAFFIGLVYVTFYFGFVVLPSWLHIRKNDLSYGVYLYGWPVQQILVQFFPGQNPIFNTFASSAIVLIVAALSWKFVEQPALSLKLRRA
jgi:peptidoglycan/LPS O-acetylase OafA/YrhL